LIAGFVVAGTGSEMVLVRGIGPSLSAFGLTGVLSNPQLVVKNSNGVTVASNAGWGGTLVLSNAIAKVGAFPLPTNSKDAALLVTLPADAYTVQLSGVNETIGVGLVEIYEMP